MRYERLTAIGRRHDQLLALIQEGRHSSRHLAGQLGVSEQTIYRDIVFLKRRGHSITSVKLASRWAYQLGAAAPAVQEAL
jgi:predicted DNA-binding transcriptional regulator YafY